MDELLIEDKKYVSSKQAAKVTGYAKDYIGQLCREGRVPARLVGRSWYVLESAIHDHRFGKQTVPASPEPKKEKIFAPVWESPRYEASPIEALPSVNRFRNAEEKVSEVAQNLQESWKEWFDRVAEAEAAAPGAPVLIHKEREAEAKKIDEEEVNIPVRSVYRQPPEELLPPRIGINRGFQQENDEYEEEAIREAPRARRGIPMSVQLAGVLIAVVMAGLAVLGSGHFDEYVLSHTGIGAAAGVGFYNK